MSLRGITKALKRTPHQLIGSKSAGLDDSLVAAWEHDIKTAIAGIEFLITQEKKWSKTWINLTDTLLNVATDFRSFHEPFAIPVEGDSAEKGKEIVDEVDQFSKVTSIEMKECEKLFKILYDSIGFKVERYAKNFEDKAKEMVTHLESALKLITKRNHKKIDYDMSKHAVDKLFSKAEVTEKDQINLEKKQVATDVAENIYEDLEVKTLLIIPHVLSTLSEFLNKLTVKLYYQQWEIYESFVNNMEKYVQIHGLLANRSPLEYDKIIGNFLDVTAEAYVKLGSLDLFNEYNALQKDTMLDKTTKQLRVFSGQAVGATIEATGAMVTKTFHPKQNLVFRTMSIENPVRPYSREGMFVSASDPIKVILDELRSQYETYENTGNDSTLGLGIIDAPTTPSETNMPNILSPNLHSPSNTEEKRAQNEDDSWMKPLSLTPATEELTENENFSLSSPNLNESNKSIKNSVHSTTTTTTAKSSFQKSSHHHHSNDKLNDTAKYTDVKLDTVNRRLFDTTIHPIISRAPISKQPLQIHVSNLGRKVASASSITANVFFSYSNDA